MSEGTTAFFKLLRNPLKFRLFLLAKLPSAFFSGVRIQEVDEHQCVVTVPYKWFSQNPFRSTYFACLAMAGELSTGALAMAYVYKRNPSVSMLVVTMQADYFKKADSRTIFTCSDGDLFARTINDAVTTGQPQTLKAKTVGRNKKGEMVAEFFITWSFKAKGMPATTK